MASSVGTTLTYLAGNYARMSFHCRRGRVEVYRFQCKYIDFVVEFGMTLIDSD